MGSSPDMDEVKTCGGVSWVSVKDAIEKLERPAGVPMLSLTSSTVSGRWKIKKSNHCIKL